MHETEIRNTRVYLIATLPLWFFAPLAFIAGFRMKLFDITDDRTLAILVAISLLLSALIGLIDFEYLKRNRVYNEYPTWIANLVAPIGYFFLRAYATVHRTNAGFGLAVICTAIWVASVGADVIIDGAVENWISPYTLLDSGEKVGFCIAWALVVGAIFAVLEKLVSVVRGR
jgi:hypothetical protein